MYTLLFVTGASGAGKTATVERLQKTRPEDIAYYYFDSIGVPSHDEMVRDFGSGDEWQRQTTRQWVKKIIENGLAVKPAILDGQMRVAFILEACKDQGLDNCKVVLFDCSDTVRKQRLIERGHPELANEDMMNWAAYLRKEAFALGGATAIDTSELSIAEAATQLDALVK